MFVIFGLLAMNWFADGTKSKQSVVILLCVRSDLHLTEFATFGMYTSLKASAAVGKLWSSCCLLLLRDVSLVTATVAPRHRTNDASSSTQLPRRTSIRYSLGLFFLLLASWLVLISVRTAALSDGICFWYRVLMLVRGKLECRVYITSNRNVGQRYASPLFGCRISLSFSRMTTSPRLYFWSWTGSPLRRRDVLLIYEILRLVVSELLFLLLVNRSPRFGCIAGCRSLYVYVWARGRSVTKRYACVTRRAWERALCFFCQQSFSNPKVTFSIAHFLDAHLVRNWPLHFSLGLCNF